VSQSGLLSAITSGGAVLETLTGNSGGPVGPDAGFNINILGNNTTGINVVGMPGTSTLSIVGLQATTSQRGTVTLATNAQAAARTNTQDVLTPSNVPFFGQATLYVVDASGNTPYTTIQSAVNAANAAGGGIIIARPGTYTENLILFSDCHIGGITFADAGGGVTIIGQHTPPTSGGFVFNNVALQSATNIFNSAAAGTTHLIIANAAITVTNGYTFNLLNWTGKLEVFDVNDRGSTNDGFVNNTAGAEIAFFEAAVGAGNSNTMTCSGVASIFNCAIGCPINCVTGSNVFFELNVHLNNITFSNNSTGEITLCEIDAQTTMSSSGAVLIATSIINTAANPAIAGSGAGTLSLNDINFINNHTIANTLTLNTTGGWYPPGNVGTSGFVLTSNGPGVCPTFQAGGGGGSYYSLTPYIVGADSHSQYSTIQAAINQAITDGASNSNLLNIYIKPGTYTEDLNLSDGICLIGFTPNTYFPDLIQAGILPISSVILDGSITSGGSGAATNIISGISQVLTGAGNAINISSTGILYLKNFTSQIDNGTIIVVPAASQAIIIADTSNFISDQIGNAVQLYALGDGSGFTFYGNQVQIYVGPNEIASTTGTGSQALINLYNSSATYSQVAETTSSISISATSSNINGAFAPFLTANVDSSPGGSSVSLYYSQGVGNIFTDNSSSGTLNVFYSNWSGGYTGVPVTNIFQNISSTGQQGLNTSPSNSQDSSLSLGSAYLNPFGYDVMLTIYINITVSAGASILCGVGNTSTPTQQTIYNSLSVTGIIPVSVYLPVGYYALISTSGTITAAITGQQVTPV
jgi:hypothetical protein